LIDGDTSFQIPHTHEPEEEEEEEEEKERGERICHDTLTT
jgi:hypothetical protein